MSAIRKHDRASKVDSIQSDRYDFPYHYIPNPEGFPFFARQWGFSGSYIAAIKLASNWLSSLHPQAGYKHMDYGCGDGGFVNALAKLAALKNVEFAGVDFDDHAIRWAKMFAANSDNFQSLDIATLPENTFDSGTLIEVFEHIPPSEAEIFVKALAKSLKKSAPLFITVPSVEKPVSRKHYRHFDFNSLADGFKDLFEVEAVFGFEKKGFLVKTFSQLMMNKSLYLETKLTSRWMINQLSTRHAKLDGCGRIGMIVRKK